MELPEPPNESDCCNSGCNPCILDVYEAQLKKYQLCGSSPKSEAINAVSPTSYTIFALIERKQVNKSVCLYTFKYADCKDKKPNCLGHKPGQYFLLRAKDTQVCPAAFKKI
ncbi:NADH-cytochrome b5 reductase-like [Tribolium madens]|uniref:NADH-cytochrome b5 reductase-like n=1 Tax=Tribolium madens TaxID=41895 RepID=UPI001CF729EB|nr:NADH-cytochrome b5 reductase-like [Tribolium madens]